MNSKELAELDLGSLFQFDLLKKVIEHFLKEQKTLLQKVNHIDERVKKENNQTAKAIFALQNQINRLPSTSIIVNEEDNPESKAKPIQDNNSNNDTNTIISIPSPLNKMQTIKTSLNIINEDYLSSDVESINITRNKEISPKKDFHPSYVPDHNTFIAELDRKVNELTQMVEELKEKASEFNVYDAFKSSEEGGERKIEIDLVLVKALETKVFAKFTQLEGRVKLTDQSLAKVKVDLTNTTNKSDSAYRTAFQQKDQLEQYITDNNLTIEDLESKLNSIKEESNEEMNILIHQTKSDLLKAIDERLSNKTLSPNKQYKIKETVIPSTVPQEILNEMQNELKLMINKSISDSEKYVKGLMSELGVDSIRKEISSLQKQTAIKLEKKDLQDLFLKFDDFNSIIQGMKEEIGNMETNIKNNAQVIEKLLKRSEFLTNLIYSKNPSNSEMASASNAKLPSIDFTKYATQKQLNQLQTTLQAESEKLSLRLEELKKLIDLNEDQHRFFASEKDLRNMEQCIINELDEYKISAMKKFSDKIESQKSFRFLDLEIKHLAVSLNKKDKGDNNENWLISKRPLGMYQCASCESIIGDLSVKSDYIPWNRIQSKEDAKKYRMGHGFSKMLQMVNTDLLRSAETAKEPHSDGEQPNEYHNHISNTNNKEDKSNADLSVSNIQNLPKILQASYMDISQETNEHIDDGIDEDIKRPKV